MSDIQIDFGNDGFTVLAEIVKDRDQWRVGIGLDTQSGIFVYDPSPFVAVSKFKDAFRNESLNTVDFSPRQGTTILVTDSDLVNDDVWNERVFVTKYRGLYYCSNPFDKEELLPWLTAKPLQRSK